MFLALALFAAGFLTILLPCILPLVPIVLGVSIAGQSRLRPLFVVMGMVVSFVAFTFALHFLLTAFPYAAGVFRTGTFAVLLLFGVGFLTASRYLRLVGAMGAALFFLDDGIIAVMVAAAASIAVTEAAGWVSVRIQQTGTDVQLAARGTFGTDSPLTAFFIGLTLGLIWVPCAGPALGFAFALVRDEPGLRAAGLLASYALGTAVPLLAIGYGGQRAVRSVRFLSNYTGLVKRVAGVLLIGTAILLQMRAFERLQVWLVDNTPFGDLGTRLEEMIVGDAFVPPPASGAVLPTPGMQLPKIIRAPMDAILGATGTWHNAETPTAADLKGKVILVDFWTYSCINCIRTLPYIQGYREKYANIPEFLIVGVHTPEFAFEGVDQNVQDAIDRHGLTYPVVQDNDYAIWNAFSNRYWPAKYLIDADGYVRYTHFGEGGYEETNMAIASLLQEIGVDTAGMPIMVDPEVSARRDQTPETYLGERSWPALQNAQGDPTTDVVTYGAPAALQLNRYALVGDWQLGEGERQVLRSATGEIRMKWQGSEINLVMGLEDPASSPDSAVAGAVQPVEAEAWIDGVMVKKFLIDRDDLFTLYDGEYGEHDLVLKISGKGAEVYAFTFGS